MAYPKGGKPTANKIAVDALTEQGFKATEIAKMIGIAPTYVSTLRKKSQHDLSKLEGKAYKTVRKLVSGEPVGAMKEVKDSTALKAAEMILDRTQPKQVQEQQGNISFTQINLNNYTDQPGLCKANNELSDTIPVND